MHERKRLGLLEDLKEVGGPFTSAEQVESFLTSSADEKKTKKRLKQEVQYARDTTTLLPMANPLFRIRKTLPSGNQRDKTATEFVECLMCCSASVGNGKCWATEWFRSPLRT